MRATTWLLIGAMVGACGSENALRGPVQVVPGPDAETSTTSSTPTLALGALAGRVCAPDGSTYLSLADVALEPLDRPGEPLVTQSDGQGFFLVEDVPAGRWGLRITKGSFVVEQAVEVIEGERTSVGGEDCVPVDPGNTSIAVVTGSFDHIEDVLDVLALEYDTYNGRAGTAYLDLLRDPDRLASYDIVFLNCGMGDQWRNHQAEINANLQTYVRNGGSVYASDWAYYLVESTWPATNDFHGNDSRFGAAAVGRAGQVQATVLDPAMVELLDRSQANLRFDLGMWVAMVDAGPQAEVLIEGTYRWDELGQSGAQTGPLATRVREGDGTVVFTSFHNENQATADMAKLLQEIILSL